ncbi:MAG: hydroxymethylbilane synthase [Methanomicrobiales archaeon]|jgi:hydroxymethylbilane synthase|nr:hydroxymethylbilane synthase [Methanomicrobiales archaeon]
MSLKIGTRGSRLALAQADRVCTSLRREGYQTERVIITTEGDIANQVPLHAIGGQGVFVRALDEAILSGEIDAAVHSMKDIPAIRPEGVITSAILTRDSPADLLVTQKTIEEVTAVGTSSTRRRAQLLRHDPALSVKDLRGNVDTRLRKLDEGLYDAIVIAEAGIQRLGLRIPGTPLPPDQFVPSANQGTIAVVSRDDISLSKKLGPLDDPDTRFDVMMERAVMEQVGGGCFTPLGIWCARGHLIAEILSLDGKRQVRTECDVDSIAKARERGRELRVCARDLIKEAYAGMGRAV